MILSIVKLDRSGSQINVSSAIKDIEFFHSFYAVDLLSSLVI